MLKVINPEAFGYDDPIIQLIKNSSRGLIGSDRKELQKRAGASILDGIDSLVKEAKDDEILIHLLAMGATESVGPNRNGDGFRREVCKKFHPTFVKHALFYRNHKNKDRTKSYGQVLKSAYNDDMDRIELICRLNGSKEAAARNGGLVADEEMEKLASGKEIPVSMACTLPYDTCSYCGNKAATPAEYCEDIDDGGHCKAGGLKENMGSLVDVDGDLIHLHADNDNIKLFDISKVYRPADRTAYVFGQLQKRASNGIIKSAELAESMGLVIPASLINTTGTTKHARELYKLACDMAAIEKELEDPTQLYDRNQIYAFADRHEDVTLPKFGQTKFSYFLADMAKYKILLPLNKFLELATNSTSEKAASVAEIVSYQLPGIYNRLCRDENFINELGRSAYTPANTGLTGTFGNWAVKQAANFSVSQEAVDRRRIRAALELQSSPTIKTATVHSTFADDAVSKLAKEYAIYKLEFLNAVGGDDFTARMTVLQNYC